ncbi:hypothetical protein [Spirillospora sp. NBC_01491]|uniref:hypothetical protein n=1 Tax=Spirillospora sp. NBC_01491 TaxID=2976007 RepID=UPI002E347E87|nr:hypothetical protein [Spirillospora sp. NBC_01491]
MTDTGPQPPTAPDADDATSTPDPDAAASEDAPGTDSVAATSAADGNGEAAADGDGVADADADGDGVADAGGEAPAGVFAVRTRPTWRGFWQLTAFVILFLASAGFVASGLMRREGAGSVVFVVLGMAGIALFGAGMMVSIGAMLARRPVLELTDGGVRRPARWPLPRRTDRTLPWERLTALTALRRGVAGARGGEQDFLVFLPTAELAAMARTAERPQLVALTLRDVPATAAATGWCFAVEPGWDATLPQIVKQVRRRNAVPVVDRRTR